MTDERMERIIKNMAYDIKGIGSAVATAAGAAYNGNSAHQAYRNVAAAYHGGVAKSIAHQHDGENSMAP